MPHYDEEFKEKLIREIMSSSGRSIPEIHGNAAISEATLYGWRKSTGEMDRKARKQGNRTRRAEKVKRNRLWRSRQKV